MRVNQRLSSPFAEESEVEDDYSKDGSVDLKGNPVRRSHRGRWSACFFIIVYEVFERTAYYGISSNLITYLTDKLHQGTLQASNNVTNWTATVWITPIFGAYLADAHLGRYRTFIVASFVCLIGMSLLTLAVSMPSLKPPPCLETNKENCKQTSRLQLAIFFTALYTLALGTGGTKPNISTIGADQFDDFHPGEKAQKLSFFNWWMFSIFFGTLFATTTLVYIQENVGWSLGYGIPTVGLAIAILIFAAGTPFYRHKLPTGSPFIRMAKVIVATALNWRQDIPNDSRQLYELQLEEYSKQGTFRIDSTSSLRFLNKAAIRTGSTHSWKLCTVTQVEETKQMLRMIPILICTFIPSTMLPQAQTLFIKQGRTLNRSVGSQFQIPPASLTAFVTISMLISVIIYDRFFVKIMQKLTNNPRGITLLQRMGIGMILHILIMTIASLVERHRLHVARKNGLEKNEEQLPLTIFTLFPQFMLVGVADAFSEVAKIEFFYDQAPESMKSLGTSYSMTSLGIGNFLSSFLLSTVSHITKKHGNNGWIENNLNVSHLDYYYAFLAVLSAINFFFFLVMSKMYEYKAEVSDSIKVLTDKLKASNINEKSAMMRGRADEGRGHLPPLYFVLD
ncbi:protein NRT1/ PTR FAMILY 5.2-like [Cucumis melo var. makuwa]|uniref:Protein NRT1/ PTR FAMILY 5.2-like n=1 Tax=Cucumis melo var. makuwa TaxID=1194695 RepID=A0A5A7U6D9_CUCMM|nr:protein NRT1/ PTR FAMILY 5.2-like [Cucumis melo var. makuwa]TYK17333.1 protein NRT1/ PTR FAMILY 5.2-like [Cucumis melo var. makuwa]